MSELERIGDYEVLGELGRGAMGVVYRGRKASLPDREVALKVVPLGPEGADRERKLREARALLQVHSVHIVQLIDVFEAPERSSLCIVMERLKSETLRDRLLAASGGLDTDEVIGILDAILDALEAAHGAHDDAGNSRPVVHRDLKPENVGYQVWRGGEIIKVMDFGVARIVEAGVDARATAAAYTPAYAAPELLRGEGGGPAVDLFAVGLVAWELLVGRHPLADARGQLSSSAVVQAQILAQPIPALPEHLLPRIPEALVDLVRDLCAVDPALRPSAHEARERLGQAQGRSSGARASGRPQVSVRRPSGATAPSSGGSKVLLIAGVGVLVLLAVAGGWVLTRPDETPHTPPPGPPVPATATATASATVASSVALPAATSDTAPGATPIAIVANVPPAPPSEFERDVTSEVLAEAIASSFIGGESRRHGPEKAFDGLPETAWNENAAGSGVGEFLEARFNRPVRVSHLTVTPGWDHVSRRGADLFTANRVMASFDLELDGGVSRSFSVPPGVRNFRAEVGAVVTSRIRIIARSVVEGPAQFEDLSVSEVRVFEVGAPPGAESAAPAVPPVAPPVPDAPAPVPAPDGMVSVAGGSFLMGSEDGAEDEAPVHRVQLEAFSIDRTEVTVTAYLACVRDGTCPETGHSPGCNDGTGGRGDHPVTCVTWDAATRFCGSVGKRLPTEAEWELAARGADQRRFPWGNQEPDCTRGDFTPTGATADSCNGPGTSPVASFPAGASPSGALDMAGNAWEWVADLYGRTFYAESQTDRPTGPTAGTRRVIRGGTWGSPTDEIRAAERGNVEQTEQRGGVGFRCAR